MQQMLERVRQGLPAVEKEKKTNPTAPKQIYVEKKPEVDNEPLPTGTTLLRVSGLLFRTLINTAKLFVDEMTLTVTKEGVRFRSMDQTHISLADFNIPSSACERFFYEADQPSRFTFDLENQFHGKTNVIKGLNASDTVTLEVRTSDPPTPPGGKKRRRREQQIVPKLTIEGTGGKREYVLALVERQDEECPLPKLDFAGDFTISTETFAKVLKDMNAVGNNTRFDLSQTGLIVSTKNGGDGTEAKVELEKAGADLLNMNISTTEPVHATYDASYLAPFINAIKPLYGIVKARFTSKRPLLIECRADANVPYATVDYWLAPRIESDPKPNPDEGPVPPPAPPTEPEPTPAPAETTSPAAT